MTKQVVKSDVPAIWSNLLLCVMMSTFFLLNVNATAQEVKKIIVKQDTVKKVMLDGREITDAKELKRIEAEIATAKANGTAKVLKDTVISTKVVKGEDILPPEILEKIVSNPDIINSPEFQKELIQALEKSGWKGDRLKIASQKSGQVVLEFDNKENANLQFTVFDFNGNIVQKVNSQGNNITINGLSKGIYFIQCVSEPNLKNKIIITE